MGKIRGMKLGLAALAINIIGGIRGLGGIWLIVERKRSCELGAGHVIGYLLLCVGAALSILGALLMSNIQ